MSPDEHQLIPFQPARLRGEKLLVLAPHPDDEVIGCGGVLAQHAAEQRQVRVVVATDGSAADPAEGDLDQYRQTREAETNAGLAALGLGEAEFLRFADRDLARANTKLRDALKRVIDEYRPDLILTPSPIEIHPDHLALTRALIDLVQGDADLLGRWAMTRVAFYEVSQPIRPNTLVDITDAAEKKFAAIAKHASQLRLRDYERLTRGLNAYRALSLAPKTEFAEAYWVTEMTRLQTEPWT
ncbi:MAG TPA: PIG-L deacetylase family protein, partial [Thermoanaerobaculia bacterium]